MLQNQILARLVSDPGTTNLVRIFIHQLSRVLSGHFALSRVVSTLTIAFQRTVPLGRLFEPTLIPLNSYRRIASLTPPPPPLDSSIQTPPSTSIVPFNLSTYSLFYIHYHQAGSRVSVRDLSRAIATPPYPLSGGALSR